MIFKVMQAKSPGLSVTRAQLKRQLRVQFYITTFCHCLIAWCFGTLPRARAHEVLGATGVGTDNEAYLTHRSSTFKTTGVLKRTRCLLLPLCVKSAQGECAGNATSNLRSSDIHLFQALGSTELRQRALRPSSPSRHMTQTEFEPPQVLVQQLNAILLSFTCVPCAKRWQSTTK